MLNESLLESIYEGPLESEPWFGFVSLLRQHLAAEAVSFHLLLPSPQQPGFDVADAPWDVRALRQHYSGRYYSLNPFDYERMEAGKAYNWLEFTDTDTLLDSPFYREFCQPVDLRFALCMGVATNKNDMAWLHIGRTSQQGPFEASQSTLLESLHTHLKRSLALWQRIHQAEDQKVALEAAIDKLAIGTVMLDGEQRVISTNDAADRIFNSNNCLGLRHQKLKAQDADINVQLQDLLSREAQPGDTDALAIPRAEGLPLGLLVRRFTPQRAGAAASMVYLSDPSDQHTAPQQLVSRLFGLSPSEAKLATLLAEGKTLAEAAADMHISEGSARSYSKRIFAKTGISRQAELVRLVLKSVAILAQP